MNLDGQKIEWLATIGSMYDGDCLQGRLDDGTYFRLPAKTVLQMVNEFVFTVKKKRVYFHLTEANPLYDEHGLNHKLLKESENDTFSSESVSRHGSTC